MEDESGEITSKDEHEPSYEVEQEFLQDNMMPYADERLADESWFEEYERRQEERDREMNELTLRLNGQNPVLLGKEINCSFTCIQWFHHIEKNVGI